MNIFHSRTLAITLWGVFLAAMSTLQSATAAVGRTTGSFSVSATGQANYSIPIWTPPGIQGIQPALALVYSSGGGDSYYGVGWDIAGLSKISRCSKTWAQDGAPRDVRNDLQDRFCLDGNQLKLTAGTYGVAGSTYQTELETFSRITAAGIDGNGPASFTVEAKNGLIYEYGNTVDSRIESVAQTTARAWLVNKVRDRAGNAMLFNYTEDTVNGGFRISTIQYTQNTAAGVSPLYSVSFVYETLPVGEVDSSYFAGSQIKRITRVDRIDVLQGATVIRRYELTYEAALSSTSMSRLASVQECGLTLTDCFTPTTFTYQNGTPGVAAAVSSGISLPQTFSTKQLDVNGDGRMDVVYSSAATPGTGSIMVALANTSGGYGAPINTGVSDSGFADSIIIDYDSNGFEDLMMPYTGGTWWVMLGSASGLAAPTNTGAPVTATGKGTNAAAIDIDGDGRQDLVWADLVGYSGGDTISYRLRLASGGFSATVSNLVGPLPVDSQIATGVFRTAGQPNAKRVPDFNGDGRGDVAYMRVTQTWNEAKQKYTFTTRLYVACPGLASFGWFDLTGGTTEQYGDFNGDGRTDMLVYQGGLKVAYSTGINFTTPAATGIVDGAPFFVMDWDGDGYDDVLTGTGSILNLYRSTGETFAAGVSTGISTSMGAPYIGDVNGDGLYDISYRDFSGVWQVMSHAGVSPDLLLSATDGFGMGATFAYASLSQNNYTKYSDATFPEQDYQGSKYVVSSLMASTGVASPTTYTQSFWYYGARIQLQGRGFEGFDAQRMSDNRTGAYRVIYRNRTFPYSGMPYQDDVLQPNYSTLIQRTQSAYTALVLGAGLETRYFPYPSSVTSKTYGLGGGYDGVLLATTVTSNTAIDSTSGEITGSSTVTTEASGSNGINASATWTSATATTLFNDIANWCIGRSATVQQTNSHSLVNGGAQTRSTSATWTGAMCRPTQTDVEPSSTTLRVTTTYGFDAFGHVNSQSITGSGMTARTSTTSWGTDGYFSVTSVNAQGHTSTATYNYTAGAVATATDPNGLSRSFVYDNFGRKVQDTRPDGTYTTWTFNKCTDWVGACYSWDNNYYRVNQYNYANNGSVVNWIVTFHDPAGRMIDRASINGASQQVNERWIYNSLSQLTSQSTPARLSGGEPFYYSSISYDLLGRQTQVSHPISSSNSTLQYSTTTYAGLTTTVTDAQSKSKIAIANANGQVARSVDHAGYYQQFSYDSFGNPVQVTDLYGTTLQSASYNIRGMRTASSDADMGSWTYAFNALGEMTSHTDANAKTTSYTFDALSRPLTRVEPGPAGGSITRTWVWGNNAPSKNIGQLYTATISGTGVTTYSETNSFDTLGRASQRDISDGTATFSINTTYNSTTGLMDAITYPTSTAGYRHQIVYEYSNGQPWKVRDVGNTVTYWQANAQDALGNITDETLGNGLRTTRSFDVVTGFPAFIRTGPSGGSTIQNLNYTFDLVGNLSSRNDANQSLTEAFSYDNLYRLTGATLNGVTNFSATYTGNGNVSTRGDVGTYTYHATKVHAVVAAGGFSYGYDANGNLTSRNGSSVTWYASNLPQTINNGSSSSSFEYTPSGQYWKQVASGYSNGTETTKYIGGLLEIVQGPTITAYRHYIKVGGRTVAIYTRGSNGVIATTYPLIDHLGSPEAVTDASGALIVRESFAAFGARRGSNWSGSPSSGDMSAIANTSRRGFTDHSMLDNIGLVHMNGRVFDPVIGRFLSADPNIDGTDTTGGWNRYSYVQNNPLSRVDPTGFKSDDQTKKQPSNDDCTQTGSRICGGGQTDPVSCSGKCGDTTAFDTDNPAWAAAERTLQVAAQIVNNLFAQVSHLQSTAAQQVTQLLSTIAIPRPTQIPAVSTDAVVSLVGRLLPAIGAVTISSSADSRLPLYRVVGDSELAASLAARTFLPSVSGLEGKYFWTNITDARDYAAVTLAMPSYTSGSTHLTIIGGFVSEQTRALGVPVTDPVNGTNRTYLYFDNFTTLPAVQRDVLQNGGIHLRDAYPVPSGP